MFKFILTARCYTCEMFEHLFDNPYHYSGQVLAKLCVNFATLIWASVVLWKKDALIKWGEPDWMASLNVPEDTVAWVLVILIIFALLRLFMRSPPKAIGACAYGVFLLIWLYTWGTLIIAIHAGESTVRPGQLAGVSVITFLAMFAFIANPKKRHGSPCNR